MMVPTAAPGTTPRTVVTSTATTRMMPSPTLATSAQGNGPHPLLNVTEGQMLQMLKFFFPSFSATFSKNESNLSRPLAL